MTKDKETKVNTLQNRTAYSYHELFHVGVKLLT